MTLSVIIPFYKGNKYVNRSVSSVVKAIRYADEHGFKGLLHDSEILIVNDSPEERVKLEKDYPSVRIIANKENMGVHASRAVGIEAGSGTWIHMLDQDDAISEKFYESQLDSLKGRDADVIVANALMKHRDYSRPLYRSGFSLVLVRKPKSYVYFGNRIESPGQCLILKDAIPEAWLKYHQKVNGADDMLLWLMMFGEGRKFITNKDVLYRHNYTSENVSLDEDNMCGSLEEMAKIIGESQPSNRYLPELREYVAYKKGRYDEVSRGRLMILRGIDAVRSASRKIRG